MFSTIARRWLANDNLRRALWTLAQVSVGLAITEAANLPPAYAAPIAVGLSVLKAMITSRTTAAVQ